MAVDNEVMKAHRRAHRLGRPAKLALDPELRAFVEARLHELTFPEIASAVAEAFPAERRVSMSSIYRWWRRTGAEAQRLA